MTEVELVGKVFAQDEIFLLTLGEIQLSVVHNVKSLVSLLDSVLLLEKQVPVIAKSAFYLLYLVHEFLPYV